MDKSIILAMEGAKGENSFDQPVIFERYDDHEVCIIIDKLRLYGNPEELINAIRQAMIGY